MNQFTIRLGDKSIDLTVNQYAPQANASVLAQMGKTVVLATVVLGKVDETKDYFPLSVEFIDKLYAGGLIKGGKWIKRETGPSDNSILFGRIIDRSIRPMFPEGFQNEVQLIVTVLSNDKETETVIPAFIASSLALNISDIPFSGPVSAVRLGLINKSFVLYPYLDAMSLSEMNLLVCANSDGINMIEAEANMVSNETVLEALKLAKITTVDINQQITEIVKIVGKKKVDWQPYLPSAKLIKEVDSLVKEDIKNFLSSGTDGNHLLGESLVKEKVKNHYQKQIDTKEVSENILMLAVDTLVKDAFRVQTLQGDRFDKRALDEIRPLHIQTAVLPCTHGSALFQRGLTQVLTVTTLSSLADKQYLQDSLGETTKRYFHYYLAPPFSTGEPGRLGRPGRREIGHGALAEKALKPLIPSEQDFPYTIGLTSEVLSQNGSSSMASACGSTLSLMDAGVPIKDKVAGISIGMVSDKTKYLLLTDIAGIEDYFGDMDFKITGTRTGITVIQLDIKCKALTMDMIHDTFSASTKARLKILDAMEAVIAQPRAQLSPYAPKIKLIKLPEDKIGDVIGSGGKTIKALMEKYHVEIDIDDFGATSISSPEEINIINAAYEIESMIKEIQIGEEYDGVVTRVENYGAFVEFLPGREALLHVSEMSTGFISDPQSIIKVGDKIHIRISGFNDNHQIKLAAPAFKTAHLGDARPTMRPPQRASYDRFRRDR